MTHSSARFAIICGKYKVRYSTIQASHRFLWSGQICYIPRTDMLSDVDFLFDHPVASPIVHPVPFHGQLRSVHTLAALHHFYISFKLSVKQRETYIFPPNSRSCLEFFFSAKKANKEIEREPRWRRTDSDRAVNSLQTSGNGVILKISFIKYFKSKLNVGKLVILLHGVSKGSLLYYITEFSFFPSDI